MIDPRLVLVLSAALLALGVVGVLTRRGAISILNVDAEYYPESGFVHEAMGEAYLAAADTAQAIVHYEKAVALEPRNMGAKKVLEALKGGGK